MILLAAVALVGLGVSTRLPANVGPTTTGADVRHASALADVHRAV
jgi:hypothetical protein